MTREKAQIWNNSDTLEKKYYFQIIAAIFQTSAFIFNFILLFSINLNINLDFVKKNSATRTKWIFDLDRYYFVESRCSPWLDNLGFPCGACRESRGCPDRARIRKERLFSKLLVLLCSALFRLSSTGTGAGVRNLRPSKSVQVENKKSLRGWCLCDEFYSWECPELALLGSYIELRNAIWLRPQKMGNLLEIALLLRHNHL